MKKSLINLAKIKNILLLSFAIVFAQVSVAETFGQKPKPKVSTAKTQVKKSVTAPIVPKVTQIDAVALKNLLKREGENAKPLLINFWATWCDPCREEFPELVEIDADYKEKIDFITISLDDVEELNRAVPKFLTDMKAQMPAYLLKTDDEEAAIASVTKDWQGGLPFTVLINEKGEIAYIRQGKIKAETVRSEIDKVLQSEVATDFFRKGKLDAEKDIIEGKFIVKTNTQIKGRNSCSTGEPPRVIGKPWEDYGIVIDYTLSYEQEQVDYMKGYNYVSEAEIKQKYGENILKQIRQKFAVNSAPKITELILTQK